MLKKALQNNAGLGLVKKLGMDMEDLLHLTRLRWLTGLLGNTHSEALPQKIWRFAINATTDHVVILAICL